MSKKLLNLGLAGILTFSSSCSIFYRTKIEETKIEVIKQEPVIEEKLEEQIEQQEQPKIEEVTPENNSQELTYKERILHVREFLQTNQEGDRNIHTYQFENNTVHISLPIKKELRGRNDLLYLEIVQTDKSFLYVHLPENEYPDAAIEGSPGILAYLFDVYDKGGNLEASIWWNYTIHRPPNQEQLQLYESIITELERTIHSK